LKCYSEDRSSSVLLNPANLFGKLQEALLADVFNSINPFDRCHSSDLLENVCLESFFLAGRQKEHKGKYANGCPNASNYLAVFNKLFSLARRSVRTSLRIKSNREQQIRISKSRRGLEIRSHPEYARSRNEYTQRSRGPSVRTHARRYPRLALWQGRSIVLHAPNCTRSRCQYWRGSTGA